MPLFGAHMSVAGGLHLAFERMTKVGGEALQIFSRNQRQWRSPELTPEAVALFRRQREESGSPPVACHAPYLINLASGDGEVVVKSEASLTDELERTEALGMEYLVLHPGTHGGRTREEGIERFVAGLDRALERATASRPLVLIENTAGQGSGLGSLFEEIGAIITGSRHGERLGVCFDTCHAFAAGYDFRTPEGYSRIFADFERLVGLDRLRFFHINDSRKGSGSHVDRHWHIGQGGIGLEGFRLLVNDVRFRNHPMVLETPKGKDLAEDVQNLRVLRSLVDA